MPLNFKKINMESYFDSVIAQQSGPEHANTSGFGGSAHTQFEVDAQGVCQITMQPISQQVNADGSITPVWGPARDNQRSPNYHDPVQAGTFIIDPDGSWGTWVTNEGYVEGAGTKPVAKFGPDGICIQAGFTPGGRYYEVGADGNHPSQPPSSADTNSEMNALLTAAVNYAKAVK